MPLIKSISGIRGTIGGKPGETLSPIDVVKFTAAYGTWILENNPSEKKVVLGRDARISGEMIQGLVISTLNALGFDVVDLGLTTTPTAEMAVLFENAAGAIILTASHNPKEWNALKLLNNKSEFISAADGARILEIAKSENFLFAPVDKLGGYQKNDTALAQHIDAIIQHPLVDVAAIKKNKFKIVVDAINSSGAIAVPALLRALGVKDIVVINDEPNGKFAHNPEPLPQHLSQLCNEVNKQNASLGIAVDPDVDRLCFVCEDGSLFGEEYTLVAIADYYLMHRKGNTVSNMSSTRALKDVTVHHGGEYFPSAVGEVNVVSKMKDTHAIIGGEGNGGVIYPESHYGRDALVGIALFLSHLAHKKMKVSALKATYPPYFISKQKVQLTPSIDVDAILNKVKVAFSTEKITDIDGVKIDFPDKWVHLRKSNTEPIIRIYAEAATMEQADKLGAEIIAIIQQFAQ